MQEEKKDKRKKKVEPTEFEDQCYDPNVPRDLSVSLTIYIYIFIYIKAFGHLLLISQISRMSSTHKFVSIRNTKKKKKKIGTEKSFLYKLKP